MKPSTPVGKPLTGHDRSVTAVSVGALPDGSPVIVSAGGFGDHTVRLRRLANDKRVGKPLPQHGPAHAVAVGTLADGTAIIVSGGGDGTVRVWRLADGTPVGSR